MKIIDPRMLNDEETHLLVSEVISVMQGVSYNQAIYVLNETMKKLGDVSIDANFVETVNKELQPFLSGKF